VPRQRGRCLFQVRRAQGRAVGADDQRSGHPGRSQRVRRGVGHARAEVGPLLRQHRHPMVLRGRHHRRMRRIAGDPQRHPRIRQGDRLGERRLEQLRLQPRGAGRTEQRNQPRLGRTGHGCAPQHGDADAHGYRTAR
jgi:hypothetical protein